MKVGNNFYTSAIFNCNYSCNDVCKFCFNAKNLNKGSEISLEDVKENYYYVKGKYNVKKIIISGGEPSLYSSFWEMMDFFYNQTEADVVPSLNTNSIKFSSKSEYKHLVELLKKSPKKKKQISISFSTVSSLKKPSQREKQKIAGVENTIKAGLKSMSRTLVVIIITKDNYKILPEIADFLINLNARYTAESDNNLCLQIRNPYFGKRGDSNWMDQKQINATLNSTFSEILPYLKQFLDKILKSEIRLSLNNIPLCALLPVMPLNKIKRISGNKESVERRLPIDYQSLFSRIKPRLYMGDNQYYPECKKCNLYKNCSKIQPAYLERGYIKNLTPIN